MKRILSTILIALFSLISTSYAQIDLEKADGKTLIHMLKFIRSPEYSDAVPAILPLLRNASENVVRDTCRTLAVIGKTNAIPAIELLLKDKRVKVRVDAENALKVLRGEGGNTFPGTPLLVSLNGDPGYALQTLKLIRRPEFAAAVRSLMPLLQHRDEHVVRDTCRTLAVIADKSVIPSIQPLTTHRNSAIRKDAKDAIAKLEAKP